MVKEVGRRAPKGMHRVIGVIIAIADGFSGGDDEPCTVLVGDYPTLLGAKRIADKKSGTGFQCYVYSGNGKRVYEGK